MNAANVSVRCNIISKTRCLIVENLEATGLGQGIELKAWILISRRHPGVSDTRHDNFNLSANASAMTISGHFFNCPSNKQLRDN
jgi:hypothetical protein